MLVLFSGVQTLKQGWYVMFGVGRLSRGALCWVWWTWTWMLFACAWLGGLKMSHNIQDISRSTHKLIMEVTNKLRTPTQKCIDRNTHHSHRRGRWRLELGRTYIMWVVLCCHVVMCLSWSACVWCMCGT